MYKLREFVKGFRGPPTNRSGCKAGGVAKGVRGCAISGGGSSTLCAWGRRLSGPL